VTTRLPGRVPVIVGPTASGKTDLAIALAGQCGGEIVSADSRQIYRFLDIGTAKPTPAEREAARHHLIDFLNPDKTFSAGEYAKKARPVVRDVLSRRKIPIVAGGSGLYVRALIDGMFEAESKDESLRALLKKRAEQDGPEPLHAELGRIDPVAAERIHPRDARRIIRALEVFRITGKPISDIQRNGTRPSGYIFSMWGIAWPRAVLYGRIDSRVDDMIRRGFVDEVRRLLEMGYTAGLNSLDTLGYREAFRYLSDEIPMEEMIALIKQNTRRFAKRQLTWFRADPRIRWIEPGDGADWPAVADRILKAESSASPDPS